MEKLKKIEIMKTIAQQLNVKEFPFIIKDSNGNEIYYEISDKYGIFWCKNEYDSKGNLIYYEDSDGRRNKIKYDSKGNEIYFENSDGFWRKTEYDSNGNKISYEDSEGLKEYYGNCWGFNFLD